MKRLALVASLLALALTACGQKPAETAAPAPVVAPVAVAPADTTAAPAAAPAAPADETKK